MNIIIEKGNMSHLDECEQAISASILGEKYFSTPGSARNAVLEGIRETTLYVAMADGVCAGFFYIIPKGAFHSFPYLHLIAVRESFRGRGIGKVLLDHAEEIAFSLSDKIFLVVADFNPDAKRFYERNGYHQVGEIPGLYRHGITEQLMVKEKPRV